MRSLKVNLTVEDVQTKEILIVTGDLSVLQQLVSGAKIALPHVQENDLQCHLVREQRSHANV